MSTAEPLSDLDARSGTDVQPGPVLAAVTLDEQGRSCLRYALRRAAETGRSAIALHVAHETEHNAGQYRRHGREEFSRSYVDVAGELLADLSAGVVAGLPEADAITLRQLVIEGLPAGRIAEVAELTGAGVVIVGGEADKPLWDRWFGRSVVEAVRRRAPCPVLTVDSGGNLLDAPRPPHVDEKQSLPPGLDAH